MASLEGSLAAFESKIAEAEKSAVGLTKALRYLKKAASSGQLSDLEKGLAAVMQRAEQARQTASLLPGAWGFDAKTYLEQAYREELQREAQSQGLKLVERDGRLYCFPLVLRLDPEHATVRIGTKRERRLRPRDLVRQLLAIQRKRQQFNAQKFLDALYHVYRRTQGTQNTENGRGPVVPLAEIHDVLTLLPGTDYPMEEFGRDLLLLARQPDLRTRDGCSFDFPGSTMSKERVKRITIYDEDGGERTFIGLRFNKDR